MKLFDEIKGLFRRPRFKLLTLFVTNRCNARCGACFYWRDLNKRVDALSPSEYRRIAAQMPPLDGLLVSGGEPTLVENLAEIIGTFVTGPWQTINMPTNGLRTDQVAARVREILERLPENQVVIGVSIDAKELLNDEIRGVPGIYRAALRTLEELARLKGDFPNLRLTTLTTVMDVNQNEVGELLRDLAALGHADFFSVEPLRHAHPSEKIGPPDPEKLAAIHEICNELSLASLRERHPEDAALMLSHIRALNREQIHVMKTGRMRFDCLAGEIAAVLEPDGAVRLCELLDPVGNVRDFDCNLMAVLQSRAAREQIGAIRRRDCSCTHCVNVGQSLPFHFLSELARLRDQRRIEKTRPPAA
jgi:MoaA/NifB/PqqE/SkfB family radical SAM enzyme